MTTGFHPLMPQTSEIHPSQMSASQRAHEIADLLAIAWLRGRYKLHVQDRPVIGQAPIADAVTLCDSCVETDPVRLGFTAEQSVNANPSQSEGVQ